ncbi:MAG: hypothetical protein KTR14_05130 [Vampirovibrio sp.]|nr:hypothetical protein [Vampirovibrio sp.]
MSPAMTLAERQKAMGTALLQAKGHLVLDTEDAWQQFAVKEADATFAFEGLDRKKLLLYESLIRGSMKETLLSIYPHTLKFFEGNQSGLTENYRRSNPSSSFKLSYATSALPEYLRGLTVDKPKSLYKPLFLELLKQYPFLPELAEYEWQEAAVALMPDQAIPEEFEPGIPDTVDEMSRWQPVWNLVRQINTFHYNIPGLVEQVSEMESVLKSSWDMPPVPCQMLFYRDPKTFKVRFFQLNDLTAAFLTAGEYAGSYQEIVETLHREQPSLRAIPVEALMGEVLKLLQMCFSQQILLGSVPVMPES